MAINKLTEMLGPPARECYRGHGEMERIFGEWGVPQVQRNNDGSFTILGPMFVASLFRCPTCGAVEIVDEDRS